MSSEARGTVALVCIACPIGCPLTVTPLPDGGAEVSGNRCPRGDVYGREELLAPRRIVTAVVPTDSRQFPFAPVRTDVPLARGMVGALLQRLYATPVSLPIRQGDVLLEDFEGVRVLFTRSLPPDDISPVGEAGPEPEGENEVPALQKSP
jgi:CxxC motif-containing protein